MNKKYLALIPLLGINLSHKELEATYGNRFPIHENIFKNPSKTKYSQNKVNLYLQIELDNFINLIAENINLSSIKNDNKFESLEITSKTQYQTEKL